VPHLGGDALHNQCADKVPQNGFPGSDVLVDGKRFDALQPRTRVLWEVKTDNFDTYSPYLRSQVVQNQRSELQRERELAKACGFGFRVGVRSAAHRAALLDAEPDLDIVVMEWC
jgi:translation elongation factor EF-4